MVYTVYVERRASHDAEAKSLLSDLHRNLLIDTVKSVRYLNRYFVEGITEEVFMRAVPTVFSEPQTDIASFEFVSGDNTRVLCVEYLPGQYDQRADSCEQCVQIIAGGNKPVVKTSKIYVFEGDISDEQFEAIKKHIINPVEARETGLSVPSTLIAEYPAPADVEILEGFCEMGESEYSAFAAKYGLAMDGGDVEFCQKYFRDTEKRDPSMTELRLIDSYWSDHCRHTTFLTSIDSIEIKDKDIAAAFENYTEKRGFCYGDKKRDITLMDIGTLAGKYLKKQGILKNTDDSDEINACSVKIKVKTSKGDEDWLLMFKNETHNHPTEIEPFGGAATCLGGAIRDPLSGRAYVYQAMRVTGAADPRLPIAETMAGKLPQSRLTVTAANGYSSYGNQIGLATGGVYEIYHPNYVAKRLEIGAVVGAAPIENVIRECPQPGNAVILLGGRTGRDGCGGATGSSKAHTASSLTTCGAEVQKGNPPVERKIQRLFRSPEVTRMIIRCNDFGAGGVSVAIGELADGLDINLSLVPKKYEGLDGTELAISESQERMAVVVKPENIDKFIAAAERENLEATHVATVTGDNRLRMMWNGKTIVDISRDFLNSNGAKKHSEVKIAEVDTAGLYEHHIDKIVDGDAKASLKALLSDLNICSQKGLVERFDASIGASTVVMPYGGKYQLSAPQYMAAKLPVLDGDTDTASVMAYGFDPYISERSPFHGAYLAVVESIAKLVASGASYKTAYLTFQEYFERLRTDAYRWGKPFAALLGAFRAQTDYGVAAIGGKDSMSGSFENLDVVPTLVSFAITASEASKLVTSEFKKSGSNVYYIAPKYNSDNLPDVDSLKAVFDKIHSLAMDGKLLSAYTVGHGGIAEAIVKMSMGNKIGFEFNNVELKSLFENKRGGFIVETEDKLDEQLLGKTTANAFISVNGETFCIDELIAEWEKPLENVFPTKPAGIDPVNVEAFNYGARSVIVASEKFARPRVIIPVFPGTNCEYDTARAFNRAGAECETFVLRNLTADMLEQSTAELAELIDKAQIMMLPGGFSGGDEPDGSGKFITAVLRSPRIKEAVTRLLEERGGLMLGICNGFQALVKSGLLPYGKIMDVMQPDCPTLTFNGVKRHQSMMVTTRISSVKSPWLAGTELGQTHVIPISHGEGRFTASEELIRKLAENGQIATQYVDLCGNPTMDARFNPNSSDFAIEGICSADGRILGKMGHSERIGKDIAKNVPGDHDQKIFESGVKFFK